MVVRSFFSGCGWFSPRSTMDDRRAEKLLLSLFLALLVPVSFCETDPNDLDVLKQFRNGLLNPEVLKWPENDDDPCGTPWPNIYCTGNKVSQIQVRRLGLQGSLPGNFNQLSMLSNLGLQENNFSGPLPTFNGMKNLRYAFLDFNNFSSIPADFFTGLDNLEVLALDNNVLNGSTGWMFPPELGNSAQLTNLTCRSCNLVGPLPEFLGTMSSLTVLLLSSNRLSGEIPASFGGMILKMLWLNNQDGDGMSGPIDVVTTMTSLNSLWLHGNQFGGTIPASIGNLTLLQDLNLNENQFVGLIPDSLANMSLKNLNLNNNKLMGPIPEFKASTVSYSSNSFCQSNPGIPCAPQVMALIEFLGEMNYPLRFASSWTGNDPCLEPWFGLICDNKKISLISLPKFNLNGTLSPSVAKLDSLTQIRLPNNNLSGQIPANWTALQSLQLLDLTGNNISPPLPAFSQSVKVAINNNPLFSSNSSTSVPGSGGSSPNGTPSPASGSDSNPTEAVKVDSRRSKASILVSIVAPVVGVVFVALLAIPLSIYFCKKKKRPSQAPSSFVIHPRDPSYSDNTVKVVVANNTTGSTSSVTGSGSGSINSSGIGESHIIEAGNLVISVQVLRNVTKNFSQANEIGRGGFGVVYKGELDDGTKIAVKRMESGVISSKALDEFQAEIGVLSKVRHRHLVSLLGYAIEGNEKILVYEYMPQGALSQHLFNWKSFNLEPLSWKRRLNIALDVARGMEYLHNLAHQSFIHRDLKSSNILLGDDFKAKVADFGLVKLAPDGEKSVVTRLAGTFGYLAPEYAVTGKITTKADVFSFGVVLMELITGLMAIDEKRTEESQYLASWFWHIKSNREKLISAIDPALDNKEDIFESISLIAELAGHCTAREPSQRPDMGHAVNVLASLVEKWKPFDNETDEFSGIDYSLPLNQMVKDWQEMEGKDHSSIDLEDSKGSIPARPTGFAESFTSVDGR